MKWFGLVGSKKCTMNGGPVAVRIQAEDREEAFATFRRVFPSAGDPQCVTEQEV